MKKKLGVMKPPYSEHTLSVPQWPSVYQLWFHCSPQGMKILILLLSRMSKYTGTTET